MRETREKSAQTNPPLVARNVEPVSYTSFIVAMFFVALYVLLIVAGYFGLRSPGVMMGGNEMSMPRAVFTVVNAATLTGFRQSVAIDVLLAPGQVWIAGLMIGGMFFTLVTSSLAVVRIARMRFSTMQVIVAAIIAIALATLIGGAVLKTPDRSFAQALFLAASAFGNCGLTLGPAPVFTEARAVLALIPLSVLGGLGLPVLMELVMRRPLSVHSRIVLSMSAFIFLIGAMECTWLAWPSDWESKWPETVLGGVIGSLNARTLGLPLQQVYNHPRAVQWLLMLLMLIGASSAGTGGGLKTTTVYELFRGGDRALRGEAPGRAFGIALSWLAIFSLLIFCALLNLLQSQPQMPADRALFTIISAASNVGLSHDPLSINESNAYALATTMFLGRFLPIGVLWWMAMTTKDAEVAVG